jgi:hypothetical protein
MGALQVPPHLGVLGVGVAVVVACGIFALGFGTPGARSAGPGAWCSRGVWGGHASRYTYLWIRDGIAVPRARHRSLRLQRRDRGHRIVCMVTARNGLGAGSARSKSKRAR